MGMWGKSWGLAGNRQRLGAFFAGGNDAGPGKPRGLH
jgi:hypothetical protein